MRGYAKVAPRFWSGDTGRSLRAQGRDSLLVALYLLTSPSSNMIGLYYLPLATLCHETTVSLPVARRVLAGFGRLGFAFYDDDTEHVWVPEMPRFQIGEELKAQGDGDGKTKGADKRIAGVERELMAVKSCRFARDFYAKYRDRFSLPSLPELENLPCSTEAPSEVARSQEQEQRAESKEHEQGAGSTEQEQERAHARAVVPASPGTSGNGISAKGDWPSPTALVALWNEEAPSECPRVRDLSDGRRKAATTALKQYPDREHWRTAIGRICRSEFLRGLRPSAEHRNWKASFDWFVADRDGTANSLRVFEGAYDDPTRRTTADRRPTRTATNADAIAEAAARLHAQTAVIDAEVAE